MPSGSLKIRFCKSGKKYVFQYHKNAASECLISLTQILHLITFPTVCKHFGRFSDGSRCLAASCCNSGVGHCRICRLRVSGCHITGFRWFVLPCADSCFGIGFKIFAHVSGDAWDRFCSSGRFKNNTGIAADDSSVRALPRNQVYTLFFRASLRQPFNSVIFFESSSLWQVK